MKSSILWALVTAVSAAALIACTSENQYVLPGDDDDDNDGAGATTGDGGSNDGGSPSDGGSTGNVTPQGGAHDKFVNEVYPAIQTDCGSCHDNGANGAPIFMVPANAEASYTSIIGFSPTLIAIPENSNLVLHGEHTGPALTPAQDSLVRAWLQLEADERGLVGGVDEPEPTGPTLQEALEGFSDCMSYDDWMLTGMNTIAASQTTAGDCNGCHNLGDGGFAANKINDQAMFDMTRNFPFIKKLVSGTVDETGAFAGLVPALRIMNKGIEAQSCNPDLDNCHPTYSLPPQKAQAVDDFVSLTMEHYEAGGCVGQP